MFGRVKSFINFVLMKLMKHIPLNCPEYFYVEYPVGQNMDSAIEFIDYVKPVLDKLLAKKYKNFTTLNLWVRGSSGAILGALLASKFEKGKVKVLHLKKDGESSHASHPKYTNSFESTDVNIILDDFVSTGKTITAIHDDVIGMADKNVKCIDILIVASVASKRMTFKPKYLLADKFW